MRRGPRIDTDKHRWESMDRTVICVHLCLSEVESEIASGQSSLICRQHGRCFERCALRVGDEAGTTDGHR